MTRNKATAHSFARTLSDAAMVDAANRLLALCDDHDPPFAVVFGPDPKSSFPGSNLQRDRAMIFLATEAPNGRDRVPAEILISLAHEVGHLLDPLTSADQEILDGTYAYFRRSSSVKKPPGVGRRRFFSRRRPGRNSRVAFSQARSLAIAQYQALVQSQS